MSHYRFNEPPTPAYRAALVALRALLAAEGASVVGDAFSEVVGESHRESWRQARGVTESRGNRCIQRLLGKHCHRYNGPHAQCECDPPGADHQTLWTKDGQAAVYVSQPYPFGTKMVRETLAFCDRWGFEMLLSPWPSWHYPGNVLTVEFTRRQDKPRDTKT